jgi:hypothetical protein
MAIDLYWLPLGAGGHFVRLNGLVYEAVAARLARRPPLDLYHWLFRYEVRRWRDGVIPDVAEAVDSPRRLSDDAEAARRLLDLVPWVPTPVWGRDELGARDMWNSNSLISWLIARSGLDGGAVSPPQGGRAPGWAAGLVAAGGAVRPPGAP